jgi:hypothetical protein
VLQLSDALYEEIHDEINQRNVLNFKEDIGEDTGDYTSTDGRSKGEDSSEEDESLDDVSHNNL